MIPLITYFYRLYFIIELNYNYLIHLTKVIKLTPILRKKNQKVHFYDFFPQPFYIKIFPLTQSDELRMHFAPFQFKS